MKYDLVQLRQDILEHGPNFHIGLERGLWLLDELDRAYARIAELEKRDKEKKDKK